LSGGVVGLDLLVDVTELGVPVGILFTFQGLGVALQAEALSPQQVGDRVGGDPVSLGGEFACQVAGRERCPPQWRHRIAPRVWFDQCQQCWT
jgi:hypothetical protein